MKTVRTVTTTVLKEAEEPVGQEPKFKRRDYVEIYSGYNEGHCFWIADVRWNHDWQGFEYLRNSPPFWVDWYRETALVPG